MDPVKKPAPFKVVPNPYARPEPVVDDTLRVFIDDASAVIAQYRQRDWLEPAIRIRLDGIAARIHGRFWLVRDALVISARCQLATVAPEQSASLSTSSEHGTRPVYRLFEVPPDKAEPVFMHAVGEMLRLHRNLKPPGPLTLFRAPHAGSEISSETLGGVLCGAFERCNQNMFPGPGGASALHALRLALNFHLLSQTLRAGELTVVGFSVTEIEAGDELLRQSLADWLESSLPHSIHLGFVDTVDGCEFVPAGCRRRLVVRERIARLGHPQTKGPFLVIATRTVRDLETGGFSRAFAIPIVSTIVVLPAESDGERAFEQAAVDVIEGPTVSVADGASVEKPLFGRGKLERGKRIRIEDPDRMDLIFRYRGVEFEGELMGYALEAYRKSKLEMIMERAARRSVLVVDISESPSDKERACVLREFQDLLRRTFVSFRRGRLLPGVAGVVPQRSWFAEKVLASTGSSRSRETVLRLCAPAT